MFSPTLVRRYTPPTCSLEVAAKTSPLSQWTGKPLVESLSFELSFDDPRLGSDQRIVLKGDRQKLEALASAVTDYVQDFLQDFRGDFALAPHTAAIYGYGSRTEIASTVATLPHPQLVTQGLLAHMLYLGYLATQESGPVLQLNATQLHDLAEALETYSSDMVALPSLAASQQRRTVTRWGAIAASLLLAVGVGRTVLRQQQTPETSNTLSLETVDERGNQVDLIPPNPHASYTFTPLPSSEVEALDAQPIAPQTVDFTQPPPGSPSPSTSAPAPQSPVPPLASSPGADSQNSDSVNLSGRSMMADQLAKTSRPESAAIAVAPQFAPSLTPQQQVEEHFQVQWQSLPELREVLEYHLQLNSQGSIQRVLPIGKAAELYQPQLSFLAIGQNVSPASPPESRAFRLVLNPNGRVQVFPETPR
ncbi:hypothetical protein NIES970_14220 [[Synechococcus] sp. NIES-970]|nr:hypothetical protein NIES970_14220 [[Synechococcus] sp. NIES-970]